LKFGNYKVSAPLGHIVKISREVFGKPQYRRILGGLLREQPGNNIVEGPEIENFHCKSHIRP
jgi:hypothetical protein